MKKVTVIVIVSIIAAVTAIVFALIKIADWSGGSSYYTQITNRSVEINENGRDGVVDFKGGLPYKYSLPAFSEQGEKRIISFGASRELREGAYIRLTVMPIRGVTRWEEVHFEDLPDTVKEMLP